MKKFILVFLIINSILLGYIFFHKKNTVHYNQYSFKTINKKELLNQPIQEDLESLDLPEYQQDNFLIKPKQRYQVAARILKKKSYSTFSQTHEILPVDFVLGWNIMSKPETIEKNQITISQGNRFYFWKIPNFNGIKREDIEHNSANVHIGAINEEIQNKIDDLNEEELVYFEGFLVDVIDKSNNYRFISSLSRTDTGPGACEVFLVSNLEKIKE
jgi:hypothetical protein